MFPRGRLFIEMSGVQSPQHGERGIARYIIEHVAAMLRVSDLVGGLVVNPALPWSGALERFLGTGLLFRPDDPELRARLRDGPFAWHVTSPFELQLGRLDLQWPQLARRPENRTVVTLYDLIPLVFSDEYLSEPQSASRYHARLGLIRSADLVLCISEATAVDGSRLLDIPASRLANVGTGIPDTFAPPDDRPRAFRQLRTVLPGLKEGYVLYTGGVDHRKNLEGLIAGYGRVPADVRRRHPLFIVCKMTDSELEAHVELAARAGVAADVHFTGYVSDDVLLRLYQCAHLFVFPALYEGFGLPIAEAMRCGAPAIAADRASMREIVTDPEHRFDPDDPDAIARAIERGATDEHYRQGLLRESAVAASRFRWEEVARRSVAALDGLQDVKPLGAGAPYLRSLRSLTGAPRGRAPSLRAPHPPAGAPEAQERRHPRGRIALVTPLPPQRSGIATYNVGLIGELSRWVDVDVFVGVDPREVTASFPDSVRVLSEESLPFHSRWRRYDEVVYAFGNSEFHATMLDLIHEVPGAVIAHDVSLTGLYWWYGVHRAKTPAFFMEALRRMHPRLPERVLGRDWVAPEDEERYGILMAGDIVARASTYWVHSHYAADLARQLMPTHREKVRILPFAFPAVERWRERRGPPVIATFGLAAPNKLIDVFIEAIPHVVAERPDVRFAVVGGFVDGYEQEVARLAEAVGVSDVLELTGRIDDTGYQEWLRQTHIAVQLRDRPRGESSAAVADCMSRGIPTVVSDRGAAAELEREAVAAFGGRSPVQLAQLLLGLLDDEQRARRLGREAQRVAAASGVEHVARALLDGLGAAPPAMAGRPAGTPA